MKFKDKTAVEELCKWADVSKSSFYYKVHPGERGMKASTHTPIGDGLVENSLVVEQIRAILGLDYCVYGYHVMTSELRGMGYLMLLAVVEQFLKLPMAVQAGQHKQAEQLMIYGQFISLMPIRVTQWVMVELFLKQQQGEFGQ